MAEIVWPPKDPDETVAYTADWTNQLGSDTIASYTMAPTGTATIAKEEQDVRALRFWIVGGTNETTTTFLNTVTTASGQVLERVYSLYVASGVSSFQPASTTKRMLIGQAFSHATLNGWEYDITAEEKDNALTTLDALMWELLGRGIDLGYNFPIGIGQGNLDDDLACPDQAFFGLSILLALRIFPTMGKKMSVESNRALADAMKAVRSAAVTLVPTAQLAPGTPVGSGNRRWGMRYPFSLTG